jgi:hypothetical protein
MKNLPLSIILLILVSIDIVETLIGLSLGGIELVPLSLTLMPVRPVCGVICIGISAVLPNDRFMRRVIICGNLVMGGVVAWNLGQFILFV